MEETSRKQETKELYVTPEVRSEEVEIGVYASSGNSPTLEVNPMMGDCCPGG